MLNFHSGQRSSAVEQRTHKPLVSGSNPLAATSKTNSHPTDQSTTQDIHAYSHVTVEQGISLKQAKIYPHLLRHTFATLWLKNSGDSSMLQRLLGHTILIMTNRYCQAVGCYDAIESHKKYSPVDRLSK